MKHTPTPWEYSGNGEAWGIKNAITLQPVLIAKGDIKTNEANAEFIVRACNSHEKLVEACNYALEQIQRTFDITDQIHMPPGWLDADIGLNNARGALQETLAKATK